jgi:hypothetical protein
MLREVSYICAAILVIGYGVTSLAQSPSQDELRAAREADDARLRAETRKRIEEQVQRDEARRKERETEQRRRAGLPDDPAPVPPADGAAAPAPTVSPPAPRSAEPAAAVQTTPPGGPPSVPLPRPSPRY